MCVFFLHHGINDSVLKFYILTLPMNFTEILFLIQCIYVSSCH